MTKEQIKQARKAIDPYMDYVEDNSKMNGYRVISTTLNRAQVNDFGKEIWMKGLTDGIDNDYGSWENETLNDLYNDLESIYDDPAEMLGSYADQL